MGRSVVRCGWDRETVVSSLSRNSNLEERDVFMSSTLNILFAVVARKVLAANNAGDAALTGVEFELDLVIITLQSSIDVK